MAGFIEIVWTLNAKNDLKAIYSRLRLHTSEEKAFEVVQRILDKVEILSGMPEAGQQEPLLAKMKKMYRRLVEGHYKIVYNFSDDTIYINRVFDTRQNPDKLHV